MCGIVGFWAAVDAGRLRQDPSGVLQRMADTIRNRGPDGYGEWVDSTHGVAFAHRRLAIVDLSESANQPMASASGRYIITFNGEIYNFLRLRQELDKLGQVFAGHSDTEVMLAAFDRWGVHGALQRFIGMFAFGLWDRQERRLYLARDRIGKKPLYFTMQGATLVFGSELKPFAAVPGVRLEVDPIALGMMLRVGYVPGSRSIYHQVHKVRPGEIIEVGLEGASQLRVAANSYWVPPQSSVGAHAENDADFEGGIDALDVLLRDAVALRMIADVPLGAFLSGGIDSSAVVALMQVQSRIPVRTFTIGFDDDALNEANHARAVARHLGTDHTEIVLDGATARAVIPELPQVYDEPFADSSQIPTLLVSRLARGSVTVALSGDGGDELFCGYRRYAKWRRLWGAYGWMPRRSRRWIGRRMLALSGSRAASLVDDAARWLPLRHESMSAAAQLSRLGRVMAQGSQDALYEALLSQWLDPPVVLDSDAALPDAFVRQDGDIAPAAYMDRMAALDLQGYLPDDILVKVDRASMGVSLEARAPLLDHRVIEAASRMPLSFRVDSDGGKRILRHLAYRYVPRALLDRPKAGFGVPMAAWLRGPLREWAEGLLSEASLIKCGLLQARPIRAVWQAHAAGRGDFSAQLWNVLMFQSWYAYSAGIRRPL